MYLYNTLSRKIEEFIPNEEGKVKIYTCGPTVYHYAHIGNMKNYIGHDILVRTLKYLGYEVTRAMNITDVGHLANDSDDGEDKMEIARKREHKTSMEIAAFYTDAFFKDYDALNNLRPDIVSPATANIDFYIEIIEDLISKDIAYLSGGNVYFDISKCPNYYELSGMNPDTLAVGVREDVEEDKEKRNPADFVLWFTKSKFENHELLWDSPWGVGYPGWHIECSGISIKYLGEYLDIHGGGVDNIFPHHTNEIAQSEAYLGHKWTNYWFHNEHLLDESGKMSKSNGGEMLTTSLLISKGYDPLSFRFMCLNSHYRKQLVFSYDALNQSEATLKKLRNRIANLSNDGEVNQEQFTSYNDKFIACISDDLNTANAVTVLYEMLKDENVNNSTKLELVKNFDQVFALNLIGEAKVHEDDAIILKLIEDRNNAKKNKDFALADSIRDDLLKKGIELIDTREGTKYHIIGE